VTRTIAASIKTGAKPDMPGLDIHLARREGPLWVMERTRSRGRALRAGAELEASGGSGMNG